MADTVQIIAELTEALKTSVQTVDKLISEDSKNESALTEANQQIEELKAKFAEKDANVASMLTPLLDSVKELNSKALAALPGDKSESSEESESSDLPNISVESSQDAAPSDPLLEVPVSVASENIVRPVSL